MKLTVLAAAGCLLLAAGCDTIGGSDTYAERSESISLDGTIEAIIPEKRLFKVSGKGGSVVFRAGPQVVNFDEMMIGDQVSLEYQQSVAVGMADPADPGTALGEVVAGAAMEGEKPAGAVIGSGSTVVEFLSYDELTHTVVIRLNDGTVERIYVEKEMRKFAAARQAGDRVAVAVDRALAIAVTKVE
ncbi:hypothetical protein R3X27_08715 [Tropicimonas sp. TH_r6]|uniref:hypothetical protein n=1 Tax=Tropicimonas sp. TH_r6 TaxID=3082085 RepID=UPI00295516AE|nr:hypothetical protein [Tropicimonas sp. TH_r6]MDV7142764.1 hypothetical protein [Tropicimonas sp. TH_r6]